MQPEHQEFLNKIVEISDKKSFQVMYIENSLGRVLATDVRAKEGFPRKNISTIDGYAIKVEEVNKGDSLKIIGESMARKPFTEELILGQAVRVYAGAPLPLGADTVVRNDQITEKSDNITLNEDVMKGQNICYAAMDFAENEVILKAGSVITGRDIAMLATIRVPWVKVKTKPRVAVLSIGDELENLGEKSEVTKTVASSSLMVSAIVDSFGAESINLGVVGESEESIKRALEDIHDVDLVVTAGSSSDYDFEVLQSILDDEPKTRKTRLNLSSRVNVFMGFKNQVPVLSLPGNPIFAKIASTLFLRFVIHKMLNIDKKFVRQEHAILDRDLDVNDMKTDYIVASLSENDDKKLKVMPVSSYDGSLLLVMAKSDCIVVVDEKHNKKGDDVEIIKFDNGLR